MRQRIMTTIVGTVTAMGAVVLAPTAAMAQASDNTNLRVPYFGIQRVGNGSPGKCLDLEGQGTANGTTVQQRTCSREDSQQWSPSTQGQGNHMTVTSRSSGKCLDASSAGNHTAIQIWECSGNDNQKWFIRGNNAEFTLVNVRYGTCVTAAGNNGADVKLARCDSGDDAGNQLFSYRHP